MTDLALKIHSTVTLSIVQVSLNCTFCAHATHTHTVRIFQFTLNVKYAICEKYDGYWKIGISIMEKYLPHVIEMWVCEADIEIEKCY